MKNKKKYNKRSHRLLSPVKRARKPKKAYNKHMKAKYKAIDIAGFFINTSLKEGVSEGVPQPEGITNLKLQKMLYFAQAAYLSLFNKPLFDEDIEAWTWGPVVRSIYSRFSIYNSKPFPKKKRGVDITEKNDIEFLDGMWSLFGKYSAIELMKITHRHKPWIEAFAKGNNTVISKEVMKDYYKNVFTLETDGA